MIINCSFVLKKKLEKYSCDNNLKMKIIKKGYDPKYIFEQNEMLFR